MRILVVDDFEANLYSKSRLLRQAGFEVVEAATGNAALSVPGESLSAVILDINLPDISGLDVARRIRESPATATLPIIHLSATATGTADVVRGLEGGADAYLTEPVDPELLVATVRSFSRARQAEMALAQAASQWAATFDAISDAVALMSGEGIIYRANLAFARLVGMPRQEVLARHCDELFGQFGEDAERAAALCTQTRQTVEISLGERYYQLSSDPLLDEQGSVSGSVCIFRDVTSAREERRRIDVLTEESIRSEEFIRSLTQSVAQGIYAIDPNGETVFTNAAAEQLLGWTLDDLRGRNIHDVIHRQRPDGTPFNREECPLLDVLRTGSAVQIENELFTRKDGSTVAVACSSAPIRMDGKVAGAALAFHDISERKRLEDALRSRADRLEREGHEREEFFALVSHELRTPLTTILGWAQMLKVSMQQAGRLDAGATQALDAIATSVYMQDRLVGDMLDVSRIATGKLHLEIAPFDLCPVITLAVESLRPTATDKKLRLQLQMPEEPLVIAGDASRLSQAVSNLLSNAIKFTPAGGRIAVNIERSGAHVRIAVTDSGVGIAPEFLPRVFHKFEQGSGGMRAGGLGLGLAIVRALVEAHQGSVSASSEGPGRGATFIITLPLASNP
jgi:PAS domain S-box-containing protein